MRRWVRRIKWYVSRLDAWISEHERRKDIGVFFPVSWFQYWKALRISDRVRKQLEEENPKVNYTGKPIGPLCDCPNHSKETDPSDMQAVEAENRLGINRLD